MIMRDVINKLHNIGVDYNELMKVDCNRYQLIIYNLDDVNFILTKLKQIATNIINYSLKESTQKETHIFFNVA